MSNYPPRQSQNRSRLVFLGLLFGLLAAANVPSDVSAGTLADLAAAIDAPSLGEQVALEEPIAFQFGTLTPGAGTKVYRLMAGKQACGLYIAGKARLEIRVEDRFSIPLAKRNLRRTSVLKFEEKSTENGKVLEVVEEIEEAVIWNWFLANTKAIEGASAVPRGIPEWTTKILADPYFTRPGMELLTAYQLRVPGVVYGLLKGKKEAYLLQRDLIGEVAESLSRVKRVDIPNRRHRYFSQRLITQPVNRQWWERFPAVLVAERETIEVDNAEGQLVTITTTSELRATQDSVGGWRVNLASDFYFRGRRISNIVQTVKVDGKPVDYVHRESNLLVALPKPLASGNTVTVEVVNAGELAVRPQGDNFWSLGTWPWYPQPDLNGELAQLELRVRVPKKYTPFASGSEVSRTEDGEYMVLQTRLDKPMQFPVVAAGNYQVISETRDGITCRVATYAGVKKAAADRLITNFFAAAAFYKDLFGIPYPFTDFTIIERNTWGFGQAPPGVIFITKEAFDPASDTISRLFSRGINERLAHEIAHAWWGHVVKMDSLEEQWITESFASYSAALCMKQMFSTEKRGQQEFNSLMRHWRGRSNDIEEGGSIYLANYLAFEDLDDRFARTALLYNKGPVVLHALRQELGRRMGGPEEGDRYFFALLRSFLKSFEFHWGGTRHLVGILNEMTEKDWQPWFERYVYGFDLPEIDI